MRILTVLCAAIAFSLPTFAADKGSNEAVHKTIIERLQTARPDFDYGAVKDTPMPGIYQVQILGGPLLYTDAKAEHVVVGELYHVVPGQFVNLVEVDRINFRRAELAKLDKKDMIIFPAKGTTKAVINIFTDVDCGYCRKLHDEVPELNKNGVEVRYLAFPRAGAGTPTYNKMVQAWCASDRPQALTDLKDGKIIKSPLCQDNPVDEQFRLGQAFDVTGTPSTILMDGTLLGGYRPVKDMLEILGI